MQFIYNLTFSSVEWLAITGLFQCVLILVYILSRLKEWRQAFLAILYFFILALLFISHVSFRLNDFYDEIRLSSWFLWSLSIPVSYLFILQIGRFGDIPKKKEFLTILMPIIVVLIVYGAKLNTNMCDEAVSYCDDFFQWLYVLGSTLGSLILLLLIFHDSFFKNLIKSKMGKEKYWLIISIITTNIYSIAVNLMYSTNYFNIKETELLRVSISLLFVYLATTVLFRIYPQSLRLENQKKKSDVKDLNDEEKELINKINNLMTLDKLYHEPSFSRSDLARELDISENILSRVVNIAFNQSVPNLLNGYRVEDAKRMLNNPEIPVKIVAFEVGFNSLASFNRVFKDITGISPSIYRNKE